jgi:hypothetical protein
LADLYAYQQMLEDVPEWPIERSAIGQVVAFLAIPVVSWSVSLLVENLLGYLLG